METGMRYLLLLAALLLPTRAAWAVPNFHSSAGELKVETVAGGLEHPWGLAFLPDGRMLVTERPGRLRVVGRDGRLDPVPVSGLPAVDPQGQGGLLDVALHPQYVSNGWIYWSYAQKDLLRNNGTEVARGKLAGGPGNWRMESVEVLFRLAPKTGAGHHFGSRIVFDRS